MHCQGVSAAHSLRKSFVRDARPVNRTVAYVDGFNLYFGLRRKGWRRYYWLDLAALARSLLKDYQSLQATHYFTARIRLNGNNQADMHRQNRYLEALEARSSLFVHYGHYLQKRRACRQCGAKWVDYEEKMTDVNIATQMLLDSFDNNFDTALVVSADSDLTTPVRRIRTRFDNKRIIVALPPGSQSISLVGVAHGYIHIGEEKLRRCQLPREVRRRDGYVLRRPEYWK